MLENEKIITGQTCRLCLTEDESTFNINTVMKSLPLSEMVNFCIGIQINNNYFQNEHTQINILNTICNDCVLNVNNFYAFKQKILKAQVTLDQILDEHIKATESVDTNQEIDDDAVLQVVEMQHEAELFDDEHELQMHDSNDDIAKSNDNVAVKEIEIQELDENGQSNEYTQFELLNPETESDMEFETQESQIVGNKRARETISTSTKSQTKKQKPDVASCEKVTLQVNECLICPAVLSDILQLNDHVTTHNVVKCKLCFRDFKRYSNLKRHFLQAHSKPKPFVCDLCGLGFSFSVNLQAHAALHYSGKIRMKYAK